MLYINICTYNECLNKYYNICTNYAYINKIYIYMYLVYFRFLVLYKKFSSLLGTDIIKIFFLDLELILTKLFHLIYC